MIEQIKNGLLSSDEKSQQDSIYIIGYAFEKFRGLDDGYTPIEVRTADIDNNDIVVLKNMLVDYLSGNPSELNRASAYNALRKTLDENLKEYLVEALRKELDDSAIVLYQIMMALTDIGEDCFDGRQSLSEFDVEENIASAKQYLVKE